VHLTKLHLIGAYISQNVHLRCPYLMGVALSRAHITQACILRLQCLIVFLADKPSNCVPLLIRKGRYFRPVSQVLMHQRFPRRSTLLPVQEHQRTTCFEVVWQQSLSRKTFVVLLDVYVPVIMRNILSLADLKKFSQMSHRRESLEPA